MEATGKAFKSGFCSCKSLIEIFFSNLDLSDVTMEVGLALATGMEAQPVPTVDSTIEVPQSIS